MTTTECPFCDEPADLDLRVGTLDCPTCGVRVRLAADPVPGCAARPVQGHVARPVQGHVARPVPGLAAA